MREVSRHEVGVEILVDKECVDLCKLDRGANLVEIVEDLPFRENGTSRSHLQAQVRERLPEQTL
jgi:hypothetical protein